MLTIIIIISIFNDFNVVFNFMKINTYNMHRNTKSYSILFIFLVRICDMCLLSMSDKILKFDKI